MTIKGILFDKDGTLIEIEKLWIHIIQDCIYDIVQNNSARSMFLYYLGIKGNQLSKNSVVAWGTTEDVYYILKKLWINNHFPLSDFLTIGEFKEKVQHYHHIHQDKITLIPGVYNLITTLYKKGYKLGIATADDYTNTIEVLEKCNLLNYFHFIGTSDRYLKKPHKEMMDAFCEKVLLKPHQISIVGDSLVDLQFAKNSGAKYSVGIVTERIEFDSFKKHADILLTDIAMLYKNEQFCWGNF